MRERLTHINQLSIQISHVHFRPSDLHSELQISKLGAEGGLEKTMFLCRWPFLMLSQIIFSPPDEMLAISEPDRGSLWSVAAGARGVGTLG